jgi:N-acetylglucosamine-6-phosphate deacetylase
MSRLRIGGTRVLLAGGRLEPASVVVEDGRIAAVEPLGTGAPGEPVIDARDGIVAPGFVDTHVHGGRGGSFAAPAPDALQAISAHLAAGGVTSCLATLVSAPPEELAAAVEAAAAIRGRVPGGIEVLGVHLEGPYLEPAQRRVQRAENLRAPDLAELARLVERAGGALRVMTLAPELPHGLEAVRLLRAHGVIASIGHSGATHDDATRAFAAGASRVTHLFNALHPLHHRDPGPVAAALLRDGVHVELIADGRHVAPPMLALVARAAGPRRTVLVSDGTDVAGLPDGPQRRAEGTAVELRDGWAYTPAGELAGGARGLDHAVRVLVEQAGVPLADALLMASQTPADSIGAAHKGRIAPGADADFVVLEPDLSVRLTIAGGEVVHGA